MTVDHRCKVSREGPRQLPCAPRWRSECCGKTRGVRQVGQTKRLEEPSQGNKAGNKGAPAGSVEVLTTSTAPQVADYPIGTRCQLGMESANQGSSVTVSVAMSTTHGWVRWFSRTRRLRPSGAHIHPS